MELNERHVSQLLEAVKSTADVAREATAANKANMEAINRLSEQVSELRTQVALSIQDQKRHQDEQTAMNTRLFGTKDDGIIQRQNERIEDIRLELATDIDENHRAGKKADGALAIINGLFSIVTSFLLKQFGH